MFNIRQAEEEKAPKKEEIYDLGRLLFVVVLQFSSALSAPVIWIFKIMFPK